MFPNVSTSYFISQNSWHSPVRVCYHQLDRSRLPKMHCIQLVASLYGYVYVISLSTHTTCTGRFAKSLYYQQSVEALRRHQLACRLLGEPLQFQTLRLGDQRNWVTTEEAHVCMYMISRNVLATVCTR